ncbi:MAG TPA: hypothetical protein VGI96_22650 [Streptosporangiaceae bacterium]
MSTIVPLAVGVMLAFGWNMLAQPHGVAAAESGITQQVGQTVDEVAAQAWASASPHALPGDEVRPGRDGHPASAFGR